MAEPRLWYLGSLNPEPDTELKFLSGIKAHHSAERLISVAVRQEVEKFLELQRAHNDPEAALLVPYTASQHDTLAQHLIFA